MRLSFAGIAVLLVVAAFGVSFYVLDHNSQSACERARTTRQNQINAAENVLRSSGFLARNEKHPVLARFWAREHERRKAQRDAPSLRPVVC